MAKGDKKNGTVSEGVKEGITTEVTRRVLNQIFALFSNPPPTDPAQPGQPAAVNPLAPALAQAVQTGTATTAQAVGVAVTGAKTLAQKFGTWLQDRASDAGDVLRAMGVGVAYLLFAIWLPFAVYLLRELRLSISWFNGLLDSEGESVPHGWVTLAMVLQVVLLCVGIFLIFQAHVKRKEGAQLEWRYAGAAAVLIVFNISVGYILAAVAINLGVHAGHLVLDSVAREDLASPLARSSRLVFVGWIMYSLVVGAVYATIQATDSVADEFGKVTIGRNIPVERISAFWKNVTLTMATPPYVLWLALGYFPWHGFLENYLTFGLAITVLSMTILLKAGFRVSQKTWLRLAIAFTVLNAVSAVLMFYGTKFWGWGTLVVEEVISHRSWFEAAWEFVKRCWMEDVRLKFVDGLRRGTIAFLLGVVFSGAATADLYKRRGVARFLAWPLMIITVSGFVIGFFHCIAILWGWAL